MHGPLVLGKISLIVTGDVGASRAVLVRVVIEEADDYDLYGRLAARGAD